jgi:selenocysteine-specific translation elongation factor
MLDHLDLFDGRFLLPAFSDTDQLNKMIQQTSLSRFKIIENDPQKILESLDTIQLQRNEQEPPIVSIDHSFHVKGIGEVILGFVKQGVIKKHDHLVLFPQRKEISIRSIQVQDKDIDQASAGSRVGLAIKGATIDDLKRGCLLGEKTSIQTAMELELQFQKNTFYQGLKQGKYHMSIGMQTIPVTLSEISETALKVKLDKEIAFSKDDKCLLLDLNAPKLHYIGTGTIMNSTG